MATLNTSTNGPAISNSYQKIVNAQPPPAGAAYSPTYGQWAVFSVQAPLAAFGDDSGKESVLKVQTTGEGELIDLIEEFSDGRIQFAYVKVKDPNTTLPKNVLVGWCGEGVPERTKGYFTSHLNAVSKILHGYHVQITARSDRDLTPEGIVQKVQDASGSKYSGGGTIPSAASSGARPPVAAKPIMPTKSFGAGSFQPLNQRSRQPQASAPVDNDGWGQDAPQVTRSQLEKVESAYKPTKVDMAALQSQHEPSRFQPAQPSNGNPDVVRGGYQPIGKVDLAAIRKEAQEKGSTQDDRPTVVKGAYQPVGKVDIAEIRRKAQGGAAAAPVAPSPPPAQEEERPKSLADRSAAFTSGERLTTLPKPQVSNRFGSSASSFAGTKAPAPGGYESRPALPTAQVGAAGRSFAESSGQSPAQQWEEKRRARGLSGAGDSQPPSAQPVQAQTSGGWQSGYSGKKWGVQLPVRTGGSSNAGEQQVDEPAREAHDEPDIPTGNVGSIKDRFKEAPPMGATRSGGAAPEPPALDVASKPNAGARGVPMPGLPQRDVPAEQHQALPPPPARPEPEDEEEDDVPQSSGSPVRIAMPVGRGADPEIEKPEPLPQSAVPIPSLAKVASQHEDPEPEAQVQDDEPARGAAQAAAASTFGHTEDARSAGNSGGKEAIAQYDYEKAEDNELELVEGERVYNIDMVDEDWWMGQNAKGETGLFPSNYVELVEEEPARPSAPTPAAASSVPAPPPGPTAPAAKAAPTATAQYDYEAAEDNELSFPDGAKITAIEFPDEDWWFGKYGGREGLFPANYVQLDE